MRKKLFINTLIVILLLSFAIPVFAFPPSSHGIYEGIDVSEWQGTIDFEEVADSGIDIVYIRVSEGTEYINPCFRENYEKAKANGLRTGFYHYLTARTEEEARVEAEFFVNN